MEKRDKVQLILEFLFLIICGVILFCLSGCAPQKKLHRLLEKHPELKQKDTLLIHDTVRFEVPGVRVDSVVSLDDAQRDTIHIKQEHLTIRTFYNNDSIFISGECDTIREKTIRVIEVPTEPIIYRRPRDGLSWYHWITITVSIIVLGLILYKIIEYWDNKNNKRY